MKFPFSRALVTGGAGFIGSHIVERLLMLGLEVVSVDNYGAGKKENLSTCRSPKLKDVKCDIRDYDHLRECFEGVDVVFHNAASKKTVCLNDPRADLDTNAKGTFNVLELSRDFGVKKIVHASTGSVYGEAQCFPQDEKHPLNPNSYYGVSKLAGERYALVFARLYGLNVTVLRYFHVYGPRQESSDVGGVVAIFCRTALAGNPLTIFGDGTQLRSFTYVDDVVDANIFAAVDPRTREEVYNCASGLKITVQDLAVQIASLAGGGGAEILYSDWTPGDIKVFDIDVSKIASCGFRFKTSFEDGLRHTFSWYKNREADTKA